MNTGVQDEKKSERTKAREAFFLEFARRIRQDISQVPLMVTGGFRTRSGMEAAVASQGCDMVGIGRPAVLSPTLAKDIVFNASISDQDAVLRADKIETPWLMRQTRIKAIGAGVENVSTHDASKHINY